MDLLIILQKLYLKLMKTENSNPEHIQSLANSSMSMSRAEKRFDFLSKKIRESTKADVPSAPLA
jgi:hypothetical protein